MLDGISPPSGVLVTVAGWAVGTVVVVLVGFVMVGCVQWALGRVCGGGRGSSEGIVRVGLAVLGAVVLTSVGGAIALMSSEAFTTGLLPVEARPKTITQEREADSVICQDRVSVVSEALKNASGGNNAAEPSDADASKVHNVIRALGAPRWEAVGKDILDTDGSPGWGNGIPEWMTWGESSWDSYPQTATWTKAAAVSWLPDGSRGECSVKNRHASDGDTITVILWETDLSEAVGGAPARAKFVEYEIEVGKT